MSQSRTRPLSAPRAASQWAGPPRSHSALHGLACPDHRSQGTRSPPGKPESAPWPARPPASAQSRRWTSVSLRLIQRSRDFLVGACVGSVVRVDHRLPRRAPSTEDAPSARRPTRPEDGARLAYVDRGRLGGSELELQGLLRASLSAAPSRLEERHLLSRSATAPLLRETIQLGYQRAGSGVEIPVQLVPSIVEVG